MKYHLVQKFDKHGSDNGFEVAINFETPLTSDSKNFFEQLSQELDLISSLRDSVLCINVNTQQTYELLCDRIDERRMELNLLASEIDRLKFLYPSVSRPPSRVYPDLSPIRED